MFFNKTQQCFAFKPQTKFPAYNLNFTESEGDEIKSRLPFKIFSTLLIKIEVSNFILTAHLGNKLFLCLVCIRKCEFMPLKASNHCLFGFSQITATFVTLQALFSSDEFEPSWLEP